MKLSSVITLRKGMIKMIETLIDNPGFEQNPHTEIERKFIPVFPERLTEFRENTHHPYQLVCHVTSANNLNRHGGYNHSDFSSFSRLNTVAGTCSKSSEPSNSSKINSAISRVFS